MYEHLFKNVAKYTDKKWFVCMQAPEIILGEYVSVLPHIIVSRTFRINRGFKSYQ